MSKERNKAARPFMVIVPTEKENEAINAAAMTDPDTLPLTDEELAQFKPAHRRGRPLSQTPKVPTTIRLDASVINAFRSTGIGWQTRINEALHDWAQAHDLFLKRYHVIVRNNAGEAVFECYVDAQTPDAASEYVKTYLIEEGHAD
ncbi:MAG TPA: BrnA antitoxin family protein, partial [Pseudoduganella sp.]